MDAISASKMSKSIDPQQAPNVGVTFNQQTKRSATHLKCLASDCTSEERCGPNIADHKPVNAHEIDNGSTLPPRKNVRFVSKNHNCDSRPKIFLTMEALARLREAHKIDKLSLKIPSVEDCKVEPLDTESFTKNIYQTSKKCQADGSEGSHECTERDHSFETWNNVLRMNVRSKLRQTKSLPCVKCGKTFAYLGKLKIHRMKLSSCRRPMACAGCAETFSWRSQLRRHSVEHGAEKPHACGRCGAKFKYKRNLGRHALSHALDGKRSEGGKQFEGGKRFECRQCEKRFSRCASLGHHSMEQTGAKPYACAVCAKPYACAVCARQFAQKEHVKTQQVAHADSREKPFGCNVCSARFDRSYNLKAHTATHSDSRPHACADCPNRYKDRNSLRRHTASRHAARQPHGVRGFPCGLCGKTFTRRGGLEAHALTHAGGRVRGFECDVCGKAFYRRGALATHSLADDVPNFTTMLLRELRHLPPGPPTTPVVRDVTRATGATRRSTAGRRCDVTPSRTRGSERSRATRVTRGTRGDVT